MDGAVSQVPALSGLCPEVTGAIEAFYTVVGCAKAQWPKKAVYLELGNRAYPGFNPSN